MNMLIGLALTAVLLMGFGIATQTTTIADVSKCQVKAGETVDPDSADCKLTPAAAAGLLPNDVITSFDGKAVTSWDELTGWIRASADKQVSITVERDGVPVTTTVTPGPLRASRGGRRRPPGQERRRHPPVPGRRLPGHRRADRPRAAAGVDRPADGGREHQADRRRRPEPAGPRGRRGAGSLQRGAPRPQRTHQRGGRGAGGRRGRRDGAGPDAVPGGHPGGAPGRAQLRPGRLQPHSAAAARRRPRGRRAVRRGPPPGSPSSSAARTPAPSTSPSCSR